MPPIALWLVVLVTATRKVTECSNPIFPAIACSHSNFTIAAALSIIIGRSIHGDTIVALAWWVGSREVVAILQRLEIATVSVYLVNKTLSTAYSITNHD
jgi:hypothetical protein